MKKLLVLVAAAVVAMGSFSAFAADWVYTITSGTVSSGTSGTVSDGAWTFKATVAKNSTSLTVGEPVEAECPTEVTPLDFSGSVVDSVEPTIEYTIVKLDTKFSSHTDIRGYVGELTLPGEGLTTVAGSAFDGCSKMTGDISFPTTMTTIANLSFRNTKITSVYIAPTTSRCTLSGSYGGAGSFGNNSELTNVVFAAGGKVATYCSGNFWGCTKLVKADLSGAVDLMTYPGREGNDNYATFSDCSRLEEVIIGSGITNMVKNSLFGTGGTSLKTVRFLGPPPEMFASNPMAFPFLMGISSSQKVTTVIPLEYADDWKVYADGETLDTFSSTWAAEYVKSGIDLSKRLLLLDRSDGKDLPTIMAVAHVPYLSSTNAVAISVEGADLLGGTIKIEVLKGGEVVSSLDDLEDFGTYTLGGLEPDTDYNVRVTAVNDNGSAVDESLSFKTFAIADAVKSMLFYDSEYKVLGLYYDNVLRSDQPGCVVYEITGASTWEKDSVIKAATTVRIDPSFVGYKPTSCKNWFRGFTSVLTIEGIEYLDVSECTSLYGLFCETAVMQLDLSRFKTANVTSVGEMFRNCKNLITVYANENFSLLNVSSDDHTFLNNTALRGEKGTAYSGAHEDSEYARVDNPPDAPGYFTYKAPPAVPPTIVSVTVQAISNETATVCVRGVDLNGGTLKIELLVDAQVVKSVESSNFGDFVFDELTSGTAYAIKVTATNASGTAVDESQSFSTWGTTTLAARAVYTEYDARLVFYYDDVDRGSWATVYDFDSKCSNVWDPAKNLITTVMFDKSFKDFRPTSCANWFAYMRGKGENGVRFVGMENLDTREVTSMAKMFYYTKLLAAPDTTYFNTKKVKSFYQFTTYGGWTVMDCSSFDTRDATDMTSMFNGCTTIYANERFVTDKVPAGQKIFDCGKIVGGAGTVYDAAHTDKEYARIDGGPDSATPGYFTYKAPPHQGLMLLVR